MRLNHKHVHKMRKGSSLAGQLINSTPVDAAQAESLLESRVNAAPPDATQADATGGPGVYATPADATGGHRLNAEQADLANPSQLINVTQAHHHIDILRESGIAAENKGILHKEYKISGSTVQGVDGYYEGCYADMAFTKGTNQHNKYRLWYDRRKREEGGERWIVDRFCGGCRRGSFHTAALLQALDSRNRPVPSDLQWFKKANEYTVDQAKIPEEEWPETADFGSLDSKEDEHMKIEETTRQEKVSFYGTVWIQSTFDSVQIDGAYTGGALIDNALNKLEFEGPHSCNADPLSLNGGSVPNSLSFNVEHWRWELIVESRIVAWSDPIGPRHAWNQLIGLNWNPRENQSKLAPLTLRRWNFLKRGRDHNYGVNKSCEAAAAKKQIFSLEVGSICECQDLAVKDPSCGHIMWAHISPDQEQNGNTSCGCLKRGEECDYVATSSGSSIYVEEYRMEEQEELRRKYHTARKQQSAPPQAPQVLEFKCCSPLGLHLSYDLVVLEVDHAWLNIVTNWRIKKIGDANVENLEELKRVLADLKEACVDEGTDETKVDITFEEPLREPADGEVAAEAVEAVFDARDSNSEGFVTREELDALSPGRNEKTNTNRIFE